MLATYLKIALRNLFRNRVYSLINILGLALGVACCQLLSLYIRDEISYDKHHNRGEDVYRIISNFQSDLVVDRTASASPPIAMAIKEEVPEVESFVRILNPPGAKRFFSTGEKEKTQSLIRYEDNMFYEQDGLLADSTLFNLFTYEFLEGNPAKALVNANSVVLSEKLSRKLFGSKPALEKIISISYGGKMDEYKVTGVFNEKYNTHIKANFFTSINTPGPWQAVLSEDEWAGQNFVPSYLKLVPGHSREDVEKKINDVLMRHGAAAMKAEGIHKTLSLEAIADVYLRSDAGHNPRIRYLYVVGSIALFILLIACINFMNLSTAKATRRANEIGIRKVMGALRSSLIKQVLGEAMVIVIVSIAISFILLQIALPFFNQLADKNISINSNNLTFFITTSVLLTIITGLLAGSYPAFYLTSFQPVQMLKGRINMGGAGRLRKGLVVFQFVIAIVLICGVFTIARQMDYILQKDLGFDADAKIVLPLRTDDAHKQYDALKKEIAKSTGVLDVSGSSYIPGTPIFRDFNFYLDGGSMANSIDISRNVVDVGYLELFKVKLIAGRSFTDNSAVNSDHEFILNRTAVAMFGTTPEKIVGQSLHFDWLGKRYDFEIIGVMEDFHHTSLHEKIKPTLFEMEKDMSRYDYVIASVSPGNFEQTIRSIETTWKSLVLDAPFEYSFVDQTIQKQYDEDRRVSRIISSFGTIAMIICALGLYGLSSYMAERRFKEIGIRKVMGASVQQIVTMMSAEFVKLVIIAFLIAVPIAFYGMTLWLESFAYKMSIGWMVFVLSGLVALAIALATVSFESIKAAVSNPIDSLRE